MSHRRPAPVLSSGKVGRGPLERVVLLSGTVIALLVAACGEQGAREDAPAAGEEDEGGTVEEEPMPTSVLLMVRGSIRPDSIFLEPAFTLPRVEESPPEAQARSGGDHRLRGFDRQGSVLFERGFGGTPVADLPGTGQEQYQVTVPLSSEGAGRLVRLEVETADGRVAHRSASGLAEELELALSREEVATARRLEGGRVEVVWDASLFPMVMVLERPGGQVLGFGQDGSLIVSTELSSLEVALSNGVRSSFRTVSVR